MESIIRALLANTQSLLDGTTGISIYQRFPGSLERQLIYCNAVYAQMAGRSRDDLMAKGNTRGLQENANSADTSRDLQAMVEEGVPFTGVFSWLRPDEQNNFIEYLAVPRRLSGSFFVLGIDKYLLAPNLGGRIIPARTIPLAWPHDQSSGTH